MLRFVLGRSGFGKTEYLRRLIAEKAKAGEERLLFLVPDQISFETEAAFLEMLGPAVSRRILVLGFSRLCDYVFEKTGSRFAAFADEGIRHMVMNLALEQVSDGLTIFSRRASSRDMGEVMLSAVKEYKKCALSPDDVRKAADRIDDVTIQKKLCDTALVYEAYNALMEKSYMDPMDSLSRVYELLTQHRLFEDYTVAIDAFYGFTAQEYDVLERILCMAEECDVALCDDGADGSDTPLFFAPRRTRRQLTRIAREHGVTVAPPIRLDEPMRFLAHELCALEENLYRLDKTPYEEPAERVTVYRASEIYDECDFVARSIRKLIEEGYRYRDIAVVARSTEKYAGVLDTCFEKYAIRFFMDQPQDIDAAPIVRLITAAFSVATEGFGREDLLTLLKTGLCSYEVEDIADFENYLYVWDLSGRRLFDEFTANPGGFSDSFSDSEREQLARVEALRADVVKKLRRFRAAISESDGRGIARALMNLLYDLECDKNIGRLCDRLEEKGEEALSADLVRMWNVLCEILDKTVAVIGDYAISPRRFAELLYVNFANTEIATIPRGLDEVDIATADRGLLSAKKAVFVIGALEGEFPHTPVEAGVFTDNERLVLKSHDLPLSDSVEELFATERYYVYSALTAASERLYVSYYACNLAGDVMTPSEILTELILCVPKFGKLDCDTVPLTDRMMTKRSAFDYMIRRYRYRSPDIAALKEYFAADPDYAPALEAIGRAAKRVERRIREPELTRALFGENMRLSSTRIDTYHRCAFRYFCEYGLRAGERRRAEVDALEYGTLIHYIFENFFSNHERAEYASLTEYDVAKEISDLLDVYLDRHFGGAEDKSERFLFLFYRIKATAVRLTMHMLAELSQSDFIPVDFELGIGDEIPAYTVELGDGLRLTVRGSVDRVDLCEKDGVSFVRVVDYKTGTKTFDLSDIIYGINLQMFLYLSAIERGAGDRYGGEIAPAGVLYMPAKSATVSADLNTAVSKIQSKLLGEYTMKGVILDDDQVITAMEHDGKGVYIPVSLSSEEKRASDSNLATLEQMGAIFRRVETLVTRMGEALYDGRVDALPLKGEYDACRYCSYRTVCMRRDDDPCLEGVKLKKQEIYDELMREEGEDGTDREETDSDD